MGTVIYFALKPRLPGRAPIPLHYQDHKDELFLGPHVRLCSLSGMAHIESEQLARRYAEACAPLLQKRYGEATTVEINRWESTESGIGYNKLLERIKKDSEIIRERIATGNFVPNKAPKVNDACHLRCYSS